MRIAESLSAVHARIEAACARVGRDPKSVCLVAVSKAHDVPAIRAAHAAGQRVFGENYAQELAAKAEAIADLPGVHMRFIGHLQRNKVKQVLTARASIDTVDSLRLGQAIETRAEELGIAQVEVLVEVHLGDETTKGGVSARDLPALIEELRKLDRLAVKGLMAIPPPCDDPEASRPHFRALAALARDVGLSELSMGMSDDFEVAVEEGATLVRVGSAIFGPRPSG